MVLLLILLPVIGGAIGFLISNDSYRRGLLLTVSAIHTLLVALVWFRADDLSLNGDGWLAIDALSLLFLGITSLLFLMAAVYAVGYMRQVSDEHRAGASAVPASRWSREAIFTGCLLLFLGSMTLVLVSRHLGLLWVGIEATTLSSAPLIYFHRHQRSLEATWRYLLICSVGIALALLGNFFLAVATSVNTGEQQPLFMEQLISHAANLDPTWLKAAFLLLLVGYGTKMGLVPMHTWLPDAHSEAPAVVSALLSGALLNCALVGILRVMTVLSYAGLGDFVREQMLLFGIVSMGLASLFLVRQVDFKRMLAYSSIEHMGVLSLGIGLGGVGSIGAMFHAVNHSLTKAALFLTAGSIIAFTKTKHSGDITGLIRRYPLTAVLWLAGTLAIVGSPPFALFSSELMILQGALRMEYWWLTAGYLFFLAMALGAISFRVFKMSFGDSTAPTKALDEKGWFYAPPAILLVLVLVLGVYFPRSLSDLLEAAAASIMGH